MKKIQLTEKLSISVLSLGTWAFSGAKVWGPNNDSDSIHTIHNALDRGINLIDTAERYGDGKAEEVIGAALKGRRAQAVISTKVYSNHLSYTDVISSCEASLNRLQTDYIDIYQIHWPNYDIPVEETFRAFEKLKSDGKIREIGVCNFGRQCLEGIAPYPVVLNQIPYSLLWRVPEHEIIPASINQGITLWAYSSLAQGLLTGKFRKIEDVPLNRRETRMYHCRWNQGSHKEAGFETEIFEFLDKLSSLCEKTGFTMSEVALAFLKSQPNMGSILMGARNTHQLEENIAAFESAVPQDLVNSAAALSESLKQVMGTNADMWVSEQGGRMR